MPETIPIWVSARRNNPEAVLAGLRQLPVRGKGLDVFEAAAAAIWGGGAVFPKLAAWGKGWRCSGYVAVTGLIPVSCLRVSCRSDLAGKGRKSPSWQLGDVRPGRDSGQLPQRFRVGCMKFPKLSA